MAARSNILPGWHKVAGSSRYINPAGIEVSKRQYYNAKAQLAGVPSYSIVERARKNPTFGHFAEIAERVGGHKDARKVDSQYTKLYLAAVVDNQGRLIPPDQRDNTAGGAMAQLLEYIGIRPVGATWNVGESK